MVTKRRSVNTDGSFVVFDHLFLPVQRTGSFASLYLYLLINEVRFLPKVCFRSPIYLTKLRAIAPLKSKVTVGPLPPISPSRRRAIPA
jgi:hypothetical protein